MKTIYYKDHEYKKMYEHENGGTYFVSETAQDSESWLDVYADGTVKTLFFGKTFDFGYLEGDQVIKGEKPQKEFSITLTSEELKMIRTSLDVRADIMTDQEKANKYYELSNRLRESQLG